MSIILAIIISYLMGSIPTSYILGRLLKGIDIREHGSGNVGATNLMRVLGRVPGIVCFSLDAGKGFIPVVFVSEFFYKPGMLISKPLFMVVLGAAAVSGHIWTVFLNFKGGKGVATSIGVFSGLAPFAMFLGLITWVITASIFRYVSVSSIVMAISLPLFMVILAEPVEFTILSLALSVFICYKHIPNIKRLVKGTEYKIGHKIKTEKNK